MRKIDWLVIFFIIVTSVFSLKDLFKPNFYTSHDGIHQVVRLYYFDQALRDGQIPPRWAGGLLNGYGYPLFVFSYQFPWFIAEPLHLSGLSIFDSIKMTFLVGFMLSGVTMYIFQKELFGRLAGFVGTILYLYAPYRFSNIFVRAAIGDATSFIFPPLLFLALYKVRKSKNLVWTWIVIASLSLSAILLSHAMVFLFFLLSYLIYAPFFFIFSRNKKLFFISNIFIIILGFGIASYYFIPSLVERNFTKFDQIMSGAFIGKAVLNLKDLLYSPWGYGMMHAKEGGMSFQVGIAQWIVVCLSTILIIIFLIKRLKRAKFDNLLEGVFFLILFILSIFMMLPASRSFWQILSKFVLIDFPWRILALTIFSASILTGFVISRIKFRYFFAILIIVLAIYGNRNHLRINKTLDWTLPFYLQLEKTTNSYDEYTPRWVRNDIVEKPRPKIEPSDKNAIVTISKSKSNLLEFTISTDQGGLVRLNTIYYPGWNVFLNDREVNISYDSGLIEFIIDRGESRIVAKFTETPLRKTSNIISLSSLGIILFIFINQVKRRIFIIKNSSTKR